ncbi:hypothetical protein HPP92_016144 [Vanilla planifolia]|uniref:GOLD domain-containing protein n=1 Tax=Vanilla planifolia TaxID=51239 RepID=A0A835QHJ5_VANPL|nr:hypothetical protein HPP92_016144 [Vanilla planifolia]
MGNGNGSETLRSTISLPRALLFLLLCIAWVPDTAALWINLPSSGTKCVSQEIQPNIVVLADYSLSSGDSSHDNSTISVKVTSPYGNTLHHKEKVAVGQFAFTTSEAGNYIACFWIDSGDKGVGASVNLDWKIGIAAKDWETIARKEKIEGVELELKKLEELVQVIHQNLLYLKSREANMREVSERTNARVAWFSIMSLGVCIAVSVLQLWHLKRYFQKKKLI